MTDHATICLQKTWPLIVQLMATLGTLLASAAVLPRAEHLGALRRTRLAESLVRRWLVLKACQTLRLRKKTATPPNRPGNPPPPTARASARPPVFRLDDPYPGMDIGLSFAPAPLKPEADIWLRPWTVSGQTAPPAPVSLTPITPQAAARLQRRAQALQDVIAHTERHIARMRRRLQRSFRTSRRLPLRPGTSPCADARQRRKGAPLQTALHNLNFFAREALCACGPPEEGASPKPNSALQV
ncbi:MAG: hypothetical protein NXH78_07850 [Hyphomonadaceae bacterium]|nr:hypothetical protein [Hyphomonadaceae bacterium]